MKAWWLLLVCLALGEAAERLVESHVYFVNAVYGFRDGSGLRVNVSRNGVGVSGLDKKKLIPCLPDAEVLQKVTLREASAGQHRLDDNGFEYTQVSRTLADVLRKHRARFSNTIGNVMQTVVDDSFRALANAVDLSLDVVKLPGRLTVCFKCAGFIVRKVGPLGAAVEEGFAGGAMGMHIDQDLRGEPLASMGLGWLFEWVPWLRLVNVWMPLSDEAIIRPLVIVDTQSASRAEQVYRHSNGNDLMLLGFAESQRVYFKPRMRLGEAAVFLTGGTPHSSASLPGEECLSGPCNLTIEEIDPDVRHVLANVSRDLWRRESLEMRCAGLVIPEIALLVVALALAAVTFWKTRASHG
jgi:hypothetical protein